MSNAERAAVWLLVGNVAYVFATLALSRTFGLLPAYVLSLPYGEIAGGVAGTWLAGGGLLLAADVVLVVGVALSLAREF